MNEAKPNRKGVYTITAVESKAQRVARKAGDIAVTHVLPAASVIAFVALRALVRR